MAFAPLEPAKTLLGVHRRLAPTAGVKVSPLCFGGMSLGTRWAENLGSVDKKQSFALLDCFYEAGGNFIDTASNYQEGDSERYIGEWMAARKNRDDIVLATKYTTGWRRPDGRNIIQSNYGGMNAKGLKHSLEASLQKLQTDYIDLLYIHWWDYGAEIPEVMRALDDVVRRGQVIYLGISDTPAWIVSKANQYARDHGLATFVVYQGLWNASERDFERDVIPMTRSEGMGLCPWGAIGGGAFKTAAEREKAEGRKVQISDKQIKVSEILEKIAVRKGEKIGITSNALAYVMQKTPFVIPIIGGRKVEHLKSNIEALSIELSRDEIDEIDAASPANLGWLHEKFSSKGAMDVSGTPQFTNTTFGGMFGTFVDVQLQQPIKPAQAKAAMGN